MGKQAGLCSHEVVMHGEGAHAAFRMPVGGMDTKNKVLIYCKVFKQISRISRATNFMVLPKAIQC